jgi:hypothetical protein
VLARTPGLRLQAIAERGHAVAAIATTTVAAASAAISTTSAAISTTSAAVGVAVAAAVAAAAAASATREMLALCSARWSDEKEGVLRDRSKNGTACLTYKMQAKQARPPD